MNAVVVEIDRVTPTAQDGYPAVGQSRLPFQLGMTDGCQGHGGSGHRGPTL